MTMTAMRDLLADERIWAVAATVQKHDGQSTHFKTQRNGQLMVSVITNLHAVPLWVTYGSGDIDGRGVWFIPAVGTEVVVNFDNGEFEGDGFITKLVGKAPTGLVDGDIVIRPRAGMKVFIGDIGATENLVLGQAFKTFAESLIDALLAATYPTGTGPSGPMLPPQATTLTQLKAQLNNLLSDMAFTQKTQS